MIAFQNPHGVCSNYLYIFIFTAAILISWKTTRVLDFVGESTIQNKTFESRQHRTAHMKILVLLKDCFNSNHPAMSAWCGTPTAKRIRPTSCFQAFPTADSFFFVVALFLSVCSILPTCEKVGSRCVQNPSRNLSDITLDSRVDKNVSRRAMN